MRGLQHAECTTALVGGVNMVFDVGISLKSATMGVVSRLGRSRPFDKSADGYTRCVFM